MKKGLIAVLVLVLLYPAVPWALGRIIEQRVDEYTDQIQEQMPYLSIVQTRFTRGWFTSDQSITLGGAAPLAGLSGGPLTIHNVIHHGPLCGLACVGLARVETHFVFPAPAEASLTKIFGNADPVTIQSRLHLLGGLTTTLTGAPLADLALDEGGHLASSGFAFTIDQAAHGDRLAMQGELAQVRYRGLGDLAVELDGAAFASHSERLLRSLYSGDAAFTLEKLALNGLTQGGLPQGALTISDVHATTQSRAEAGFLTVTVQVGSGPVATKPLHLASTEFDFSYRHLNAEALESLTAALGVVNHSGATTPADRGEKLAVVLRDQGATLLLQDPEFTVDAIRLRDAAGALLVTGSVRLVGFLAADLAPGADPKALLQKLHVQVDLACDSAFLASLPNGAALTAQLQGFVQQGLATLDHGQFHSKLEFADGKPSFDGKSLPAPPGAAPARPPAPGPTPAPSLRAKPSTTQT